MTLYDAAVGYDDPIGYDESPSTTIPPWTADDSGKTVLDIDTADGGLNALAPLALPPVGFTERPIMRRSVVVPALHTLPGAVVNADTGAVRVPDDVYGALEATATVEEVGVPHVIYRRDGKEIDATYYRGGITRVLRDRREEPFGDVTMELEFARITSLDDEPDSPAHPLWWNINRANVEIVLKKSDGSVRRGVWTGHHVARDTGNDQASTFNRVSCVGTLRQASTDVLRVPNILDPTDIGELIPRTLNGVTSRRYPKIPNVSTGIVSRQRGSWADSPLGHAQNLLSTAWTEAGNQWTVAKVEGSRWDYTMRLKKTTPSWTVTNGARGVSVNLTRDDSAIRNVIFGHGVTPNGYSWGNYKYGTAGGADLNVTRLPLAADTRTQFYLYNADGSKAGTNPDWDGQVIIYADDVDFGSGVTLAEGIQSAQQILEREGTSSLTGRITLDADPREGSRLLIAPGDKITLVGYEHADRVLHIAAVERDWINLTVTLEVDERSRDAMTVAQIRERDREARRDPARRAGDPNRRSRLDMDQVVPFDGDAGAGILGATSLPGGAWKVIPVPVSEVGRVARVDFQTSSPSKFCVAFFGLPVSVAHLNSLVGNPLASTDPFKANREVLEDVYGWIEAHGSQGQAAGYYPGLESDGDPLTGRLVDTGGFEYTSHKPPWVWVAFYAQSSCSVQGRILPAPVV